MQQTIRFILDQPLKQWLTGRKRGEKTEIQKLEYFKNKKSFLDEIKHFSQFLKGYYLVKNKTLMKNSRQKQALKKHNALFLNLLVLLISEFAFYRISFFCFRKTKPY